MWDPDSAGVKLTKPTPEGYKVALKEYETSVEWVKDFIMRTAGIQIPVVKHDPDTNMWWFYEHGEQPVVSLPHNLMERIMLSLEKIEWLHEYTAGDILDLIPPEDEDLLWKGDEDDEA